MFWSGNYIAVRELNFLLKEENVTLTQVLEADDILQECKADNKALMQFLTKPKILAELITLITEEPPKNVKLSSQYRHASIACEVLTSHLSTLSDRLSMDAVQMHRLCDFINREPPLNPLLASYFSKTVEMLLERSPKQASAVSRQGSDLSKMPVLMLPKVLRTLCFAQDWYLYHVVCLRVFDFFKSRRDFLPNLLRHISTSAIADTFKYFIRHDDLFNKIIMEWFEEHQFLECLIQIICGTYAPAPPAPAGLKAEAERSPDRPEKGQHEASEKPAPDAAPPAPAPAPPDDDPDRGLENAFDQLSGGSGDSGSGSAAEAEEAEAEAEAEEAGAERRRRRARVAAANAAALLADLIVSGCAGEGCVTRPRTSRALVARLSSGGGVRALLGGVFTAPVDARPAALVHGAAVLHALLDHEPQPGGECESARGLVELAVAPHLPLLHQALLERPAGAAGAGAAGAAGAGAAGAVGAPRLHVAALLAHLALSEVEEVATTMLTLGTPGVVVDMMFAYPNNNFLHAHAYTLIKNALANKVYRTQYARHLLVECDLLTRLMDAFEENENKTGTGPGRSGYMGHVVLALRRVGAALGEGLADLLPPAAAARWAAFSAALQPLLQRLDTPLGGYYPSENVYEFIDVTATASLNDAPTDIGADAYNEMCSAADQVDFLPDELDLEDGEKEEGSKNSFLELASQRFDDDMWEDSPEADGDAEGEAEAEGEGEDDPQVRGLLLQRSPWESSPAEVAEGLGLGSGGEGGWAQFDAFPAAAPDPFAPAADPFAPAAPAPAPQTDQFAAFWGLGDANDPAEGPQQQMEAELRGLSLDGDELLDYASSVEFAKMLLTASEMGPKFADHLYQAQQQQMQQLQDEQGQRESEGQQETEGLQDIQGQLGNQGQQEEQGQKETQVQQENQGQHENQGQKETQGQEKSQGQQENQGQLDQSHQDSQGQKEVQPELEISETPSISKTVPIQEEKEETKQDSAKVVEASAEADRPAGDAREQSKEADKASDTASADPGVQPATEAVKDTEEPKQAEASPPSSPGAADAER